jgi:heptosyltransferase I
MPPPGPAPRRILIIRPSALGDVCRSVPLLVSLQRHFPHAAIDWLVQDTFAPAIAHHPDLHRVVPFPRRELARWYTPSGLPAFRRFLAELREPHYDLVIDAQALARSGFFARATRAPIRIGPADARELGWLFYTHRVPIPASTTHTVDRMLALLAPLNVPPIHDLTLYPDPAELAHVDADPRLAGRRFAVLAPTSRWPGKRWPADRFAAAAQHLLTHSRFDAVALVGAQNERDQCAPLLDLAARDPRIIDLVGRTTIPALLATIARASFVLANDSAALHMAVGLNRPLLALFGPTDTTKVGPYRRDAEVLQQLLPSDRFNHKDEPLGRAMMARLTTDHVLTRLPAP